MADDKGKGKSTSPEEEIEKYEAILAKDPQSRVFAPLAEAYRKAGFYDDAVRVSRIGLDNHPGYVSGRVALSRSLFEKGELPEAREEIFKVVQAAPDNLMAQKLLGQVELKLNHRGEAEQAFKMVLMIDPRDEEAQRYLDAMAAPAPPPTATLAFDPPPVSSAESAAPDLELTEDGEDPPAEETSVEERLEFSEEPVFDLDEMAEQSAEDEEAGMEAEGPPPGTEESPFDIFTKEPHGAFPPREETGAPPPGTEESPFEVFTKEPRAEDSLPVEGTSEVPPPGTEESPFEVFSKEPRVPSETPPAAQAPQEEPAFVDSAAEFLEEEAVEEIVEEGPEMAGEFDVEEVTDLSEEIPVFDLDDDMGEDIHEAASLEEIPAEEMDSHDDILTDPFGPVDPPSPSFEEVFEEPTPAPAAFVEEIPEEPVPAPSPFVEEVPAEPAPASHLDEVPVEPPPLSAQESEAWGAVPTVADQVPDEDPSGMQAASGVAAEDMFGTETLANLYIKQGFYEKAADVYRRMLRDRPDDTSLRQKLEEVISLEKMGTVRSAPTLPAEPPVEVPAKAAVPSPPAAAPVPAEVPPPASESGKESRTIVELRSLLERLKERPR